MNTPVISKSQIKLIRSLHQKKYRDEHGLYLAEGIKIVQELLTAYSDMIYLLVATEAAAKTIQAGILPTHQEWVLISDTELNRISTLTTPPGIMAVVKKPSYPLPETLPTPSLNLVLDGIRDPGNLGTIIRLADWFGMEHLFCSPDTVECFNPKVVQASMGALFRAQMHYTHLPEYLSQLQANQTVHCYGTALDGHNLYDIQLESPALIVMGSEANGLSDMVRSHCQQNLLIPNYGQTVTRSESLNVAIAAGIFCAEFRRQLGK